MSEFDTSNLDPGIPTAPLASDSDLAFDSILDAAALDLTDTPVREGLPSSYRMRHDAHYVDELEARTPRPPHTERRRHGRNGGDAPMEILSRIHVALALSELCRGLDGLSSCFNLIPPSARPTRERLGLELARVEARRAGRLSQNLKLLLDDPPSAQNEEPGAVNLVDLVQRVVEDMSEELQLSRVVVSVELGAQAPGARGDAPMLQLALSALMGALVAIVETLPQPGRIKVSVGERDGAVSVRAHAGSTLQPNQVEHLFDLDWIERPGGINASVGLTTARRVAQLLGGRADATEHPAGGFIVGLTLPMAA